MSEPEQEVTFEAPGLEEVAMLFPSYDVHSLIACGGMGAVYRATQRSLDREVAIKILPREFSNDLSFREGFESEAKAMGKLNHPNLIGVYDFGEADGMLFITMEYVHGQSLFHAANGNAVEQGEALRIIIEICKGLGHAHGHGILHRDIKPANILLDESLQPKIGDFGLAHASGKEVTEGDQIFGTAGYTAPEVTTPPFSFDHRADIFSVGVMLRELLTGRSPVTEGGTQSSLQLGDLRINSVIKKATHPDPASRYASAEKLAEDLVKIASDPEQESVKSKALKSPAVKKKALPSVAERKALLANAGGPYVPKTYTKQKSSAGPVVFGLILLVLGGAVFFLLNKPKKKIEPEVVASEKPKVIVIGEPPAANAQSARARSAERDVSFSPIIPMISSSGPVIQQGFDAGRFLDKARAVMRAPLAPEVRAYQNGVEENTKELLSELEKLTSVWEGEKRQSAQQSLSREFEDWQENDYLIPRELPLGYRESFSAKELHEKFLDNQLALKEKLDQKASEQVDAYVIGLEYQIDVLQDTDNEASIQFLEKEIERVKTESRYFTSLMFD